MEILGPAQNPSKELSSIPDSIRIAFPCLQPTFAFLRHQVWPNEMQELGIYSVYLPSNVLFLSPNPPGTPLRLSQLCRLSLRQALGRTALEKIPHLHIPTKLVEFLSYSQ
ncbi:hypothetical protein NXF25_013276 [Crotalus adamanteus]|uniref:SOCS box domain-containing protein n=1 Tax=Crotalus adamanteus TaxID=8729 RepID=A0AAW1BFY8_CROAD